MSDADWEMYDILFKTAHRQGRLIEELMTRVCELERRLRDREAEDSRPVLRIVEPETASGRAS